MEDFFNLDELEITDVKIAQRVRTKPKAVYYDCEQCGLYKNCQNGKMGYAGSGKSGVLIVLDSPSVKADRVGKVVIGESKRIVQELCEDAGIAYEDVWIINAIQCKHRKTNKATIPTCRKRLQKVIKELKPKSIIAMGTTALNVLVGDKISTGDMHKFCGYAIPYHGYQTIIYPVYGVKTIIIEQYNPVIWKKNVQQFAKAINPKPYVNYEALIEDSVEILYKQSDIENMLLTMETRDLVAFDYETTGLQPYKRGHKIISMSVSDGKKSYAFLLDNKNIPYVKHFLQSQVKKIAHNAKYEMIWSRIILDTDVEHLIADTMLIAHSLNNNKGIVGLKFQGFVNFGIAQYEEDIKPLFDTTDKKDIHAFNKLYYMDLYGEIHTVSDELLYYCAVDSLLTKWLYDEQQEQIQAIPHIQSGIDLFHNAMKCFVDIESAGMRIDSDRINKNIEYIDTEMERLYTQIYETVEVKQWDSQALFNFNSNKDLSHLLYDILGYNIYKETDTGQPSTDKEALEKIVEHEGSKFLELLAQYKKLDKMKSTYLEGIKRGTYNGVIHPSFNLHTVVSYRTSSSNPNWQNQPKRAKLAKEMIRSVFIPDEGAFIEELDFSALEVNISQCYNQDKNLLIYLQDSENHNMHTDSACDLFLRTKETLLEEERQVTKSGFVFSQIYGSNYRNCAKKLWGDMPKESKKHLVSKGYKTLEQYTELVKEAEYQFWNVRFKEWGQWKKDNWKAYQTNGYIDNYTGFRLQTIMSPMQAGNYAIQGSASHCLLFVLIYIHTMLKKLEMRSRIIGQIHDSIVLNMYPDEVDTVHKITKKALDALRDNWDWITIQLIMAYEQTPIDGNWSQLEKKGKIKSK